MNVLHETLSLEPGEELVAVYRRHGCTAFLHVLPFAVFIIVLFLFLFPLFSLGLPGIALFAILLLISVYFSLCAIVAWIGTITIVTNSRLLIVLRSGFFKKTVTEIQYDQISQISYDIKGLPQVLCKYGTLNLLVTFTSANITIPDMPDPQEVLNAISQTMNKQKKGEHTSPDGPHFSHKSQTHAIPTHGDPDPVNWR